MSGFAKKTAVSACVMFTAFIAVGSLVAMAFAGPQPGLVMTWTLLLAAVAFAVLQSVWFTDRFIRNLAYPARIFGFGVTAFAVLALCAWLGGWFPMDEPWAWITFAVIYLAILAACCIGYQVYFKRTSGSFDAALRDYHERMGR